MEAEGISKLLDRDQPIFIHIKEINYFTEFLLRITETTSFQKST